MKKVLIFLVSLTLILTAAGCGKKPSASSVKTETVPVSVLSPKGATAVGLLPYILGNPDKVTTVDGTDALTAAFTQAQSEYDVIIAPVNMGAMLNKKGATEYRLLGILTWGNLYLVADNDAFEAGKDDMIAFGQGAVPQKIIDTAFPDAAFQITWFNSTADVAQALLSGEYHAGVVAEPVLSNLLSKNDSFKVVSDLQQLYAAKTGQSRYPQAAVWVKGEAYKEAPQNYDAFMEQLSSYQYDLETLKKDLDTATKEVIGTPSAVFGQDTYTRMNISCAYAKDVKAEVLEFLKLYGFDSLDGLIAGE